MRVQCYPSITAGTTPESFTWTVTDEHDLPLDLSGSSNFPVDTVLIVYRINGGPQVVSTGDLVDLPSGVIGWTPVAADFALVGLMEGAAYYISGDNQRDGAQFQVPIVKGEGSTSGDAPGGGTGTFDGIDGGSL